MPQDDTVYHDNNAADNEFDDDDDVCNDNGEDYADLCIHPVQVLKTIYDLYMD